MWSNPELIIVFFWLLATVLAAIVGWRKSGSIDGSVRTRLTRLAVVAAFMIGLSTLGLEVLKRQREAAHEAEHAKEMLAEIQRVLGKMEFIRVSYEASLPARDPSLDQYRTRLTRDGAKCFREPKGEIRKSSILMINPACRPLEEQEPVAYAALSTADLCLDFFKTPIAPESYEPCGTGAAARPDLSIKIFSSLDEGLDLLYDEDRGRFLLQALNRESLSRTWKGNITITSVADLIGAQMFVVFTNFSHDPRGYESLYQVAEIETLSLNSGVPRLDADLSAETMTRLVSKRNSIYYTYFTLDPITNSIVGSKTFTAP